MFNTLIHVIQGDLTCNKSNMNNLKNIFLSNIYEKNVKNTVILSNKLNAHNELVSKECKILFDSNNETYNLNEELHHFFGNIEKTYNIKIIITKFKSLKNVFLILVDTKDIFLHKVNALKGKLYDKFLLSSDRFEMILEYENMIQFAAPAIEIIYGIKKMLNTNEKNIILSHEIFGIPLILAAKITKNFEDFSYNILTYNITPINDIVSQHPGHDITFYNLLNYAEKNNLTFENIFGDRSYLYKYELLRKINEADNIFTIGNYSAKELKFLDENLFKKEIHSIYKGIKFKPNLYWKIKKDNKQILKEKIKKIVGFDPKYIFLHSTNIKTSKAIWRDFIVLDIIDEYLDGKAVYLIFGSNSEKKSAGTINFLKEKYNWPLNHQEGYPDLIDYEVELYGIVKRYNKKFKNIKTIFINQLDINREIFNWPENFTFENIINGVDLFFGQSIYEPYGATQAEAMLLGTLVIVTPQCGFIGQLNNNIPENLIIADYKSMGKNFDFDKLKNLSRNSRYLLEIEFAKKLAPHVLEKLGKYFDFKKLESILENFSWEKSNEIFFSKI